MYAPHQTPDLLGTLAPESRRAPHGACRAADGSSTPADVRAAVAALQVADPCELRPLHARESDALALLYRRYSAMLLAVAQRLLRSRADAEDVVQDVFARLPRAIHRYRDGGIGGWLKQVTTREALMRMRRARRRGEQRLIDADAVAGLDLLATPGGAGGWHDEVRWALTRLPERLREVVVLRVFLECSHQEIAALLDCSVAASEVRLCRALKQLRVVLFGHAPAHRAGAAARRESIPTRRAS